MTLPDTLLDGYRNFSKGRLAQDRERYRTLAREGQKPRTMVIACSDSRAAPETIFDAGPGELFVVRNVANLVPPFEPEGGHASAASAIEYAVLALGVTDIVVLAHARCGGIAASLDEGFAPLSDGDFVGRWIDLVRPAAAEVRSTYDEGDRQTALEQASVRASLERLRGFPPVAEAEREGRVTLHGAWFDIETGELRVMNGGGEFEAAIGSG